jgi:Trk K+ transport system NAD-binding subunit
MANVVIFGVGQMGTPIAYAMSKLGHKLTLVDSSEEAFQAADVLPPA